MTEEGRDKILAAIWRGIERLAAALEKLSSERVAQAIAGEVPQKTEPAPEQQTLPGFASEDWTPPQIDAKRPREWCNTVKVYDVLWHAWGTGDSGLVRILRDQEVCEAIAAATKRKVHPASFPRIFSTLVRAGAAKRNGTMISLVRPTDEIREAIERVAKKRKEVAA